MCVVLVMLSDSFATCLPPHPPPPPLFTKRGLRKEDEKKNCIAVDVMWVEELLRLPSLPPPLQRDAVRRFCSQMFSNSSKVAAARFEADTPAICVGGFSAPHSHTAPQIMSVYYETKKFSLFANAKTLTSSRQQL